MIYLKVYTAGSYISFRQSPCQKHLSKFVVVYVFRVTSHIVNTIIGINKIVKWKTNTLFIHLDKKYVEKNKRCTIFISIKSKR